MKVTILGCGAAAGVPAVSNGWGACDPANPRNRRRRASILVEEGGTRILVDTTPDLREQLLDAGVRALDAVLYTHDHADHIHGLDELREINRVMQGPLPVFAAAETLDHLRARFGYAFEGLPAGAAIFRPWLIPTPVSPGAAFAAGGIGVMPFLQDHGFTTTLGYRFGDVAYSTDLLALPEPAQAAIRGVPLWIVDGYTWQPHPTHAHIARTLEWIAALKPKRAVITHMSNAVDYAALKAVLPENAEPAYDGMVLEV